MKQLTVISGKGGTGKTSILASFAALAEGCTIADCDVDAANLHLVLQPDIRERGDFPGGRRAVIDHADCIACGRCKALCRYEAVRERRLEGYRSLFDIDATACEGCGVCAWFCPSDAVHMVQQDGGEWYVSDTLYGRFVHARLKPGMENSGRLVALVREKAKALAAGNGNGPVLIDGPPGIGCPVIASLAGVDVALIVTEPTPSGLHDLQRVSELAARFKTETLACVNRCDINPAMTERIEATCAERGIRAIGRVPVDDDVARAQRAGLPLVEASRGRAAVAVEELWRRVAPSLL